MLLVAAAKIVRGEQSDPILELDMSNRDITNFMGIAGDQSRESLRMTDEQTGVHKHRCMRCREEFVCQTPDECIANYDVLPSIITRGADGRPVVTEHCPHLAPKRESQPNALHVAGATVPTVVSTWPPSPAAAPATCAPAAAPGTCAWCREKNVRISELESRVRTLQEENATLQEKAEKYDRINTPELYAFVLAVENEALHQRERWGIEGDGGKTDADWFWLIGYLAGKALHNPVKEEMGATDARLHRIVTVAAAAANWHAAVLGTYAAPETKAP